MTVTATQVMNDLREIVAQVPPDFSYQKPNLASDACLYVHTDSRGVHTPGCIAAHVFVRHGVSLEELLLHECSAASRVAENLCAMTDKAVLILGHAQTMQDSGQTWQSVLDECERVHIYRTGD